MTGDRGGRRVPSSTAPPVRAEAPADRDRAVDVTRGVAIFSMISGHFALGTDLAKPTHVFPWIDGASAFVLLSGLLLGIVHRRWSDRTGSLAESRTRLLRRAAVIYLCQVLVALTAVAVALGDHLELTFLLPVSGWVEGVVWSFGLRYSPGGGNILALYLVFVAMTALLLPVVRRGLWPLVLGASIALYAVASLLDSPDWFYISTVSDPARIQNWATWQALFVPALVVGWLWRSHDVGTWVVRHAAAVWTVATVVAAVSFVVHATDATSRVDLLMIDKLDFGPGRVVAAWTMVPAVYVLARLILDRTRRDWLRPLRMVGARSLDSYVLQAVLLMTLPIAIVAPWSDPVATIIALAVFGLCWAWAELRRAAGIDKLHRTPLIVRDLALSGRRSPR